MKKQKYFDKRIINIIIIVATFVALLLSVVIAKPFSKAETSPIFSGTGTKDDPFLIGSVNDMLGLANVINNYTSYGTNQYYNDKYYKLTDDIDFKGSSTMPIIGRMQYGIKDIAEVNKYAFKGNFDGNGYSIKNLTYTINNVSARERIGLFGEIYGDGTNNGSVYNLTIENMSIILDAPALKDYNAVSIGIITGHLGQNSSIKNCIVKNSSITVTSNYGIANRSKLQIGGIVGETSKDITEDGWSKFDTTIGGYGIENCYSNVNITVEDDNWSDESINVTTTGQGRYCRYGIGGIVGGFCNVNKFSENCIYEGTITATKGFIGPIYGMGEFSTATLNPQNYSKLYVALESGATNSQNTNYWYNTKIVNNKLSPQEYILTSDYKEKHKQLVKDSETVYIYPIKLDATTTAGAVQGVNRGDYIESLKPQLDWLNKYNGIGDKYKKWLYDETNDTFYLEKTQMIEEFSGGIGTEEDPYLIKTVKDIQDMAKYINSYKETKNGGYYKLKYYKLMNDIDFSNSEFIPIGYSPNDASISARTTKYSFQGDFDGNGYTIKNITYNLTQISSVEGVSYGLFGMLWGDGINNGSIYNLSVDNMNVNIDFKTNHHKDMRVGIIAGHLGQNSSIKNCIVTNSKITYSATEIENGKKMAIGGIVGETSGNASNDTSGWAFFDTSTGGYGIENCFSNVDIIANDDSWEEDYTRIKFRRFSIGGIVGSFCNVNKFPKSSIYKGTIQTTKAIAGPIFGYGEFSEGVEWSYLNAFSAYGSNDTNTDTNYYYKTTFINNALSPKSYLINSSYLNDDRKMSVGNRVIYPLTKDTSKMGDVQGINSGNLQENLQNSLEEMNSYNGVEKKYKKWYYDLTLDVLTFSNKTSFEIIRNGYDFELAIYNNIYDENTLKYEWYLDGVKQESIEKNITLLPTLENDRKLTCKVYSGNVYVGTTTKVIEKENINFNINRKYEDNKEILYADLEEQGYFNKEDFTYQWYYREETETEYTKLAGETSSQYDITNEKNGRVFKIVIELNKYDISHSEELTYTRNIVIYVDQANGNDNNDGRTDSTAVATLEQAYKLIPEENQAKNNIIVIIGTYDKDIWTVAQKNRNNIFCKPATICGKYANKDYSGIIKLRRDNYFNTDVIWKDIVIGCVTDVIFMYAQGNDLILEESVTIDSALKMYNGDGQAKYWGLSDVENYQQLKRVTIVGGTLNYKTGTHDEIKTRTSNIVVKCSGIAVITAGSRTQEDKEADVYGTIDKHSNVKITVDIPNSTSKLDVGLVVGGQCDSSCYINSEININNGKIGKVIGGTLGYGNAYTKNIPRDTFYGSSIININGGNIVDVFGGSLGRNKPTSYMYGKVEINVTGGTIENIYGAGSGGTMGYSSLSTDTYKDDAIYGVAGKTMTRINSDGQEEIYNLDQSQVIVNISGGTIEKSIYGGGYGKFQNCQPNPEMADDGGTLYGNTTLNITGGVIKGSVYGGAKGIEDQYTTNKPNIAQIYGNITVNISGTADIKGSVYGGSEGLAQYENMSKITGNITLNIEGKNVKIADGNSIYGGGKAGKVDGTINLKINNTNLKVNIYGAGDGETATIGNNTVTASNDIEVENKVIDLKITNSVIDGIVFGGGNSADVYGSILVKITDKSNITNAIYGGCNNANVGKENNNQNTYVYVSNAIIGEENDKSITGGEVFGGGNLGIVYGNTTIEIGDEDSKIQTKVGKHVYAGGKGKYAQSKSNDDNTTVTGNSIGKIIGTNTEIAQYGSSELGAVDGIVDIYFENYKKTSGTNKYKTMTGINKATNIYLTNSYVYLTGGLENIENLFIPQETGMMISDKSTLEGNLIGGGDLDIQSGSRLIIKGNLQNTTTLTLSPKENDEGSLQVIGGEENPYVVVLGKDESSGKCMISGNPERYTIENNLEKDYTIDTTTQKASIYYIEKTITVNRGIVEKIYNVEDKVFTSEVNNTEQIYILNNNSFTSFMDIEYSMIRQRNDNGEWVFTDEDSMKNIRRYIYLSGNNTSVKLPQNTKITMIVNNKYYSYTIPDNFGTDEFWKNISTELGVSENLQNQIPLSMFEDNNGNKFEEVTNIQAKMDLNSEKITKILTLNENYRFIIDFSNCQSEKIDGDYEIILNAVDYKENNTKDNVYTEYEQNNVINIEDRNYNIEATTKNERQNQNIPFDFKIRFTADEISKNNTMDTNKSVKLRITLLKDDTSEIVKLPKGTIIIIDGNKYNVTSNDVIFNIIDSLQTISYDKEINLQIDMSNVADTNLLENGKYSLKIDAYLADNNILLGNTSVASSKTKFDFIKAEGYGIKVSTMDSQVISKLNDVRNISIKTETGTLENGAYINIKTFKRQDEFKYVEITQTTSVEEQKVENLETRESLIPTSSTIIFREDGIFRYVYQLCDKYGNVMAEDSINFIVKSTE